MKVYPRSPLPKVDSKNVQEIPFEGEYLNPSFSGCPLPFYIIPQISPKFPHVRTFLMQIKGSRI